LTVNPAEKIVAANSTDVGSMPVCPAETAQLDDFAKRLPVRKQTFPITNGAARIREIPRL